MKRYFRAHKLSNPRGTALAVAMLVIVLLSGVGVVALNAATHDVSSAGAVRMGQHALTVSEGGLVLSRCGLCRSLDGITVAMRGMREKRGKAPQYTLDDAALNGALPTGTSLFADPAGTSRGSFGQVGAAPDRSMEVRIDRPRESGVAAGYSLRESQSSDAGSFCFRRYRVTSTGTFAPAGYGSNASARSSAEHRAFMVAGPVECSL